ncbi:hypothetical protein [Fimbriiglobus ruber]|uniref:Pyruvate/2-oxoglutarate dehydrogenase complex, dihydrolipoamide acyltransferase (E2) component n=1 Tax=Fimbriiglobus ruber TaxID=1908690 RepID=A0A225DP23_9BACT|nr:hypothetical protein [Fimbriiglobus ruber]OWK43220.1 Pyruvate/2-oxoglutarate dehydrogenase complex, dihydrolipoamide acyltransferase (E2) component [Fimbriiglobus ruber]
MAKQPGRRIALSLPRKWIADLMHFSRHVPLVTAERRADLAPLVAAREQVPDPPAWAALFLKAYAIVAARTPALRRAYIPVPWPHLYESPESFASVAVAREFQGEPAVFFGLLRTPDCQPLPQLSARLHEFKTHPVETIRVFARLIRYTRYPLPIRRVMWWLGLNLSGKKRADTIGTFGLTTVSGAGAGLLTPLAPAATILNYGPFAADGGIDLRLNFDHRVMDGMTAAAALHDLENVLRGEIVAELEALVGVGAREEVVAEAG